MFYLSSLTLIITNSNFTESPISSSIFEDSLKNSPSKESCNINKCLVNNGVLTNAGLETLSILSTNQEDFAIGDGDVPFPKHDSTAFTSPTPEPVQVNPPIFEKLVSHKYDIVLLSLLIQLLYNFSIVTFERGYFFLPLAIYVTTKLAMIPKQQNSNFANIILMLNCMPPNRAQKIMSITQLVSTFTQDVCIFLFTTICTQTLWQTLRVNVL